MAEGLARLEGKVRQYRGDDSYKRHGKTIAKSESYSKEEGRRKERGEESKKLWLHIIDAVKNVPITSPSEPNMEKAVFDINSKKTQGRSGVNGRKMPATYQKRSDARNIEMDQNRDDGSRIKVFTKKLPENLGVLAESAKTTMAAIRRERYK